MHGPRRPNFLAVDHPALSGLVGASSDPRGLRSSSGFGDAEGLESQLSSGNLGQEVLLLCFGSVSQQGTHDVHLGMAGRRVRSRRRDLFKNRGGLRQANAAAAVLLGNQRGQPTSLGEGIHEGFGVPIGF